MFYRTLQQQLPWVAAASLAILVARIVRAPQLHAETAFAADTAVFAGGCFWGIEGVFEHLKGVRSAVAGYAGGTTVAPSYEEVSSGTTGHAESVQVIYDPAIITYAQLLQVFFTVAHDPTELNRQGPDEGTQYRSVVFYQSAAQQHATESYVAELGRTKVYADPIVTQIVPLKAFYPAEAYHQHYMALHPKAPYIVYNDAPKVERLRREFPAWYTER
jgi:peptide-methionine (S)-S-oxide reductase